jgi:butyrate kinase
MYNIESNIEAQIKSIDKPKPILIFPEDDERIIKCIPELSKICHMVILTDRGRVVSVLNETGKFKKEYVEYLAGQVSLVNPASDDEADKRNEFAQELQELSKGSKWELTADAAKEAVRQKIIYSIMAVRLGYADAILGGVASSTKDFFSPCLRMLEKDGTVFQIGFFAFDQETLFPQNIGIFGDVAVNAKMTKEKLADIAVGSCKLARDLIPQTVLPYINGSILSYSTKGSGAGETVEMIREAEAIISEKLQKLGEDNPDYKTIRIHGELQAACALIPKAAKAKLKDKFQPDQGYGESNVLISTNLDLGNFLYHYHAANYPGAQKLLVSGGFNNQVLDFSRSSTVEDITLGAKALILSLLKSNAYKATRQSYFFPKKRILAINPGSTSTKIAVFYGGQVELSKTLKHSRDKISEFAKVSDQYEWRKDLILAALKEHDIAIEKIDAAVGRGGLLAPISGGAYEVNDAMCADLVEGKYGEHASNLGALIAREVATSIGKKAYIVDPVVVDEMTPKSKYTGLKDVKRDAIWHALNQKEICQRYAMDNGTFYEDVNLVVCHLGGGISIGAHKKGVTVDVTNGLTGEGPFTPERSGALPVKSVVDLCFSEGMTKEKMIKRITRQSGLVEHLGTHDSLAIEKRFEEGDRETIEVYNAVSYNIAKYISFMVPAFEGESVDAILVTGGLARSDIITAELKRYLKALNIPVILYPGEFEMEALHNRTLQVLKGEISPKVYKP